MDSFSVFTPLKTVKRSWCFCIKSELSVHHRYLTRGPRPQCQRGDKLILTITSLQGASIHRASSEPIIKLSLGKLEKLNSLTFSEACVSRQHSVTGIAFERWAIRGLFRDDAEVWSVLGAASLSDISRLMLAVEAILALNTEPRVINKFAARSDCSAGCRCCSNGAIPSDQSAWVELDMIPPRTVLTLTQPMPCPAPAPSSTCWADQNSWPRPLTRVYLDLVKLSLNCPCRTNRDSFSGY